MTQTVSTVCVRRTGMAVQCPPLRALPVSKKAPLTRYGGWVSGSSTTSTIGLSQPNPESSWAITGTWCFGTSASWAFGQLGKEQALPCADNLFSRCGVRLGEYDGTPHRGTCPSSAELPEFLQRQECGTMEQFHWNNFRGSWGIWRPQLQSRRSDCFI